MPKLAPKPAADLSTDAANPFREGALGFRPYEKGWRPVDATACPKCGAMVNTSNALKKPAYCKNFRLDGKPCSATVLPLWMHPQWTGELLQLWEVWRRIVLKQWKVNIGEELSDTLRLAALPVKPAQKRERKTQFVYTVEEEAIDAID